MSKIVWARGLENGAVLGHVQALRGSYRQTQPNGHWQVRKCILIFSGYAQQVSVTQIFLGSAGPWLAIVRFCVEGYFHPVLNHFFSNPNNPMVELSQLSGHLI